MKNEIKEKIKAYYVANDIDEILDYITNLQEEIERQSKAQVILDNQIAEMLKYKERCEKAIEYISKYKECEEYSELPCYKDYYKDLDIILGGDEEC